MQGESSGGATGNAEEMDVDHTPLAVWQRQLHGTGQAGRQTSRPPLRENVGGSNEDLGEANEATEHETLQQLRGELRRLAPTLECVVGVLTAV